VLLIEGRNVERDLARSLFNRTKLAGFVAPNLQHSMFDRFTDTSLKNVSAP
jgi:hypothetical protein